MKRSQFLFVALVLAMLLALGACGGDKAAPADDTGGGTSEPVAQATARPTDTPLPTATPTPEPSPTPDVAEEFDPTAIESPGDLDSFQLDINMSWQGTLTTAEEVEGSLIMAVKYVREPLAEYVSISGDYPGLSDLQQGGEGTGTLEIYMVEGKAYMNLFGTWMQTPATPDQFKIDDMTFGAGNVVSDLKGVDYKGRETINGIETKHYHFDETALKDGDFGTGSKIEDAQGDLYVAVEGNYLVRLVMDMTGAQLQVPAGDAQGPLDKGTIKMTMDLSSINQPIEITVPEEALKASGGPEDIPMADDATDAGSFGGMTSYSSAKSAKELAAFYKAEMPNNGWTETKAEELGDMFSLEYTKDNRTASILITTDSATGKSSVLITVQGE